MNYHSNQIPPYYPPQTTPYYLTEEFKEKKSLARVSNILGLGLILYFAFSIFTFIVSSLTSNFFIPKYNANPDFNGMEPVIYHISSGLSSIIGAVIPFLLCSFILNNKISDLIQFESFDKKLVAACIGIGMMLCVYANYVSSLFLSNLNSIGINPHVPSEPYDNDIVSLIFYIISVSIIPPLVEEFAFRGVILGSFRKFGDSLAILVSAILFGALHANFGQTPFTFVIGLYLGFLTVRFNSILPAIFIHFLNNLLAVLSDIFKHNVSESFASTFILIYCFALIIIGAFCFVYVLKKDKSFFSISRSTSAISFKKRLRTSLLSPVMVVALVLISLSTLLSSII